MEKTRLLVIEDNELLVRTLENYFEKVPNIEVSLVAKDGKEGIEIIESQKDFYDLILLDLIMPQMDGIEVLKYIRKHPMNQEIIVITSYSAPEVIHKVASLGASYLLLKPFELSILKDRINDLQKKKKTIKEVVDCYQRNLLISITNLLHELGVPSNRKGFFYLREGINLLYQNIEEKEVMKELYHKIAKKYHTTSIRVERLIRHTIEISWNRGNWDLMEELFGNSIDSEKAKPTNSEYMKTIADKLRLELIKAIITK